MKCLILAAGYATRLYPLTENYPKPLLEVKGKTILDWLVEDIHSSGEVNSYIVVSNHKYAHHFKKWAATKAQEIVVLDDGTESNDTRLGAVRDIQFAIDALSLDDDLLVIAGDNLLDFSLTEFIAYARKKQASCIMRYFEQDRARLLKSGIVGTDENDRVLWMTEKSPDPQSNWCCPPFYYYVKEDARSVERAIAAGCAVDAPGSFVAWLCKQSTVYAMQMPGRRYDIGNLESYEAVKKNYQGVRGERNSDE